MQVDLSTLNDDDDDVDDQGLFLCFKCFRHGHHPRSEERINSPPSMHLPIVLTKKNFAEDLSAPLQPLPNGEAGAHVVWGKERETGHLSWVMMVLSERQLMSLCQHNPKVDDYANRPMDELDATCEKIHVASKTPQLLALYTRKLQVELSKKR